VSVLIAFLICVLLVVAFGIALQYAGLPKALTVLLVLVAALMALAVFLRYVWPVAPVL
jgi:hypothetical protein